MTDDTNQKAPPREFWITEFVKGGAAVCTDQWPGKYAHQYVHAIEFEAYRELEAKLKIAMHALKALSVVGNSDKEPEWTFNYAKGTLDEISKLNGEALEKIGE